MKQVDNRSKCYVRCTDAVRKISGSVYWLVKVTRVCFLFLRFCIPFSCSQCGRILKKPSSISLSLSLNRSFNQRIAPISGQHILTGPIAMEILSWLGDVAFPGGPRGPGSHNTGWPVNLRVSFPASCVRNILPHSWSQEKSWNKHTWYTQTHIYYMWSDDGSTTGESFTQHGTCLKVSADNCKWIGFKELWGGTFPWICPGRQKSSWLFMSLWMT